MSENVSQLASALITEEGKLLACIHCGMCLEACPTYVHTGDENDGPRGRIYLMRAVEEKRLDLQSPSFTRHIGRCLGCRACESVCPAGVEYGQLLEAARSDIASGGKRSGLTGRLLHAALRHVWLHPARLRFAMALARFTRDARLPRLLLKLGGRRHISPRMEFALALLDSSSATRLGAPNKTVGAWLVPARTNFLPPQVLADIPAGEGSEEAKKPERTEVPAKRESVRVTLFTGCVMEGLFTRVNRATARVLEANGCPTSVPREQVCCGALHAHAGDLEGARTLARRNIDAFADDPAAPVITNAGGCGAMLLSYGHLLANDEEYARRAQAFSARVRDISQHLEVTGIRRGAPLGGERVTYDASCHLLHGQRALEAPLRMLRAIPELQFVPLEGSDVCCGGAGVYNLLETEMSARVLNEKLGHIERTGAQLLATGNPGCQMQIGAGARLAGIPLRVCHPVELLDESYARAGFYEEASAPPVSRDSGE